MRCAACVWLIEQLFDRMPDGGHVLVNPGRGQIELRTGQAFPLRSFVEQVESVGYLLGPGSNDGSPALSSARDDLLMRAGVCTALALNTMLFSAAIYLGLEEGPLHRFLRWLNFGIAALAVTIGGPVFIASAWQALRRKVVHLDLPIALAIVLTFGASLWSFATDNPRAAYHDTLAVFIALMLIGRYLQERVLVLNRSQLLRDDGLSALMARRIRAGSLSLIRAAEIRAGDILLVPPGDLLPVAGKLLDGSASCSLDWINGESEPVSVARDGDMPAGAFNVGLQAFRMEAQEDFGVSALRDLLATTHDPTSRSVAVVPPLFAPLYVGGVLCAAVGGLCYWTMGAGNLLKGLEVATAVAVVSCPCAIGIAIPLAHELAHAGLRRLGLFVRRSDFLHRCRAIRRIAFDKTGTLTNGRLQLQNPEALAALSDRDREALFDMTARSLHPHSLAVRSTLEVQQPRFDGSAQVEELPGCGLSMRRGSTEYRLGNGRWLGAEPAADLHFTRDGAVIGRFELAEELRHDATAELSRLQRLGYETWILSGDTPRRVGAAALRTGVPEERALGGLSPQEKAQWVRDHDRRDTLVVGDGINDGLAVQAAHCSGTPSIDRSFMPARTDFYFVTPGLSPITTALRLGHRLAHVIRMNIALALTYNAAAVALALSGVMRPWVAAVLMPTSSLAIVLLTTASLSHRSRFWKRSS